MRVFQKRWCTHAHYARSLSLPSFIMKKTYLTPSAEPFGTVEEMTGTFGSLADPDVSEFPSLPAAEGSFDVCEELVCGD